ncbi:hypothetical protein NQD34_018209 [Periophthalmus magnuspinnatus]|nr:hypothetical protein NQD34_018209 [Periophthalmus magnuspinnatus]
MSRLNSANQLPRFSVMLKMKAYDWSELNTVLSGWFLHELQSQTSEHLCAGKERMLFHSSTTQQKTTPTHRKVTCCSFKATVRWTNGFAPGTEEPYKVETTSKHGTKHFKLN